MAGVTQTKAWFRKKSRVCSSLTCSKQLKRLRRTIVVLQHPKPCQRRRNDNINKICVLEAFGEGLSGPVLRDTARLSQRYPPIARYGVFGVSTWPIGCDTPSPFSERFPLGEHAKWRCDTLPPQGYLSDTCTIPYENKANGCDTPLCDTINLRFGGAWGGETSRAAQRGGFKRGVSRSGLVLPSCTFRDFPDLSGTFPICPGMVRGFSRFVLFLFLGLLTAPRRNSPKKVRDTIRTFPEKSGKPPGLETPRFSFSKKLEGKLSPNSVSLGKFQDSNNWKSL